jgi:uncharacterized protein (TIGR02466 family)
MSSAKVHSIFPEPLGVYYLERDFTDQELQCIDSILLDTTDNFKNRHSSDTYVLQNQVFNDLNTFCLKSLHDFYKTTEDDCAELRITQSWLNLTRKGESHHLHVHPNSIISGVLFVEAEETDNICFVKRTTQNVYYSNKKNQRFNCWNSTSWYMPATQGTLLLFRSSLEHEVPVTVSDKRISLSFNSFFYKSCGDEKQLNYLNFQDLS